MAKCSTASDPALLGNKLDLLHAVVRTANSLQFSTDTVQSMAILHNNRYSKRWSCSGQKLKHSFKKTDQHIATDCRIVTSPAKNPGII